MQTHTCTSPCARTEIHTYACIHTHPHTPKHCLHHSKGTFVTLPLKQDFTQQVPLPSLIMNYGNHSLSGLLCAITKSWQNPASAKRFGS
uniref:Uncharacterized protein n=1 Tax=Anguilla anguilla TaxID=7936 RepID=A0A0E9WV59_ANGAN